MLRRIIQLYLPFSHRLRFIYTTNFAGFRYAMSRYKRFTLVLKAPRKIRNYDEEEHSL